jgi:hypothetical protein
MGRRKNPMFRSSVSHGNIPSILSLVSAENGYDGVAVAWLDGLVGSSPEGVKDDDPTRRRAPQGFRNRPVN